MGGALGLRSPDFLAGFQSSPGPFLDLSCSRHWNPVSALMRSDGKASEVVRFAWRDRAPLTSGPPAGQDGQRARASSRVSTLRTLRRGRQTSPTRAAATPAVPLGS